MAKPGDSEELSRLLCRWGLRDKLEELVKLVIEEEDYGVDVIDEVVKVLDTLEGLFVKNNKKKMMILEKKKKKNSSVVCVPDEFRCPISNKIMIDPVVLINGQTYDRECIEKWPSGGSRTCPRTQQELSLSLVTPNLLVRQTILRWCREHAWELEEPVQDVPIDGVTLAENCNIQNLLKKLSSSLPDQREAAKQLRHLTKSIPSSRVYFSECRDAIPKLLNPLLQGNFNSLPNLQEDLIATILNVSIVEENKQMIAETPYTIPLLVESVRCGNMETKSNAAAILSNLATITSNKQILGSSGAIKPLITLLEEDNLVPMKEAACALLSLCHDTENRSKAVHDGVVRVILTKIMHSILVDEMLALLATVADHDKAIEDMKKLGAVHHLLNLIKETTSRSNEENCVAILYTLVIHNRTTLREIKEEEEANATLSILAMEGTPRAQRKAKSILERLKKALNHRAGSNPSPRIHSL